MRDLSQVVRRIPRDTPVPLSTSPWSKYCSVRISRVGLSTKQATEPYSGNILNHTETPPNCTQTKNFPLEELEAVALVVGLPSVNPPAWNCTRNRTWTNLLTQILDYKNYPDLPIPAFRFPRFFSFAVFLVFFWIPRFCTVDLG